MDHINNLRKLIKFNISLERLKIIKDEITKLSLMINKSDNLMIKEKEQKLNNFIEKIVDDVLDLEVILKDQQVNTKMIQKLINKIKGNLNVIEVFLE